MEQQNCPACLSANCESALSYEALPLIPFPVSECLAKEAELHAFTLDACRDCGHLFQPEPDLELLKIIYEQYYEFYPHENDPGFYDLYRKPFFRMFELIVATRLPAGEKRLLEIGCSKAENMKPFREEGFSCIGIDPSPLARQGTGEPGIRLIEGYYEDTVLAEQVDVIVARHVLEHTVDLQVLLGKCSHDLRTGGLFFVQVPNILFFIDNSQPLFVSHEHVHYYTIRSLVEVIARHGFVPVC